MRCESIRPGGAVFVAALALAVLFPSFASAADLLKIRLAYVVPVATWGAMLPEKKDLATHEGKSYQLEITRFVGTPQQITALATGELDIADLAYPTLPIAIGNAGMTDLRVIADEFQDGKPGYYSTEYMVLDSTPIRSVADLKRKVVATNAAGSGVDVAMRAMLRKSGLEDRRDYTIIEAPLPAMRAMLSAKKADLVPAVLPFSYDPELRRIGRTLFTNNDAIGATQFTMWVVRKGFIDKNRAALVDFMEDTLRIAHWYLDPANHHQVMEIAARLTKQPAEQFSYAFTGKDDYRDPDMVPDLAALQRNVDLVRELGFVRAKIDVRQYADLGIVEEAAKRLK